MSSPLSTRKIEKGEALDEVEEREQQEEKEPPYEVVIHKWIVA